MRRGKVGGERIDREEHMNARIMSQVCSVALAGLLAMQGHAASQEMVCVGGERDGASCLTYNDAQRCSKAGGFCGDPVVTPVAGCQPPRTITVQATGCSFFGLKFSIVTDTSTRTRATWIEPAAHRHTYHRTQHSIGVSPTMGTDTQTLLVRHV